MSHMDSSALATYNSLVDPHLQCYFSNERIRSHLKHAGLISRRGEIVSDSEYRLKITRREHKKHVRQMLAENIVHRAIDMERLRQAELKRQLDMVAKAALVNSVKESRRRPGYSLSTLMHSNDLNGPKIHQSWSLKRPESADNQREIQILNEELSNQPRAHSAHFHTHQRHISKSPTRRSQHFNRAKSTNIQRTSPAQRARSPIKPIDSTLTNPPCQITMIYYGPHTKIDYDQTLFEPVDEIMVMQQHCGGENLIVYKGNLRAGEEFTFHSRRHHDFPLGLSLYVKGLIDSRISTCCEYKHRHGVRLGGERGHFAIVSVTGSKPCIKCRFEKQTHLKQYGDGNDTDDENTSKPITISIPVNDQMKSKTKPIQIPVRRHTSESNENYSEDFDESSDHQQKPIRSKSPSEASSTSTEISSKKTWQFIFHTSNIPTGSLNLPKKSSQQSFLKISLIGFNTNEQTEEYSIDLNEFSQCFQSGKQDSFKIQLTNIGQPKQIKLKLEINQQTKQNIKWHLDYIEIIDPQTQEHYEFLAKQWIRPFEEVLLHDANRKNSTSTNSSINKQIEKVPSRSSSSTTTSYESPNRTEFIEKPIQNSSIRRISTDNESNDSKNFISYELLIQPSDDADGEFNSSNDTKIYMKLNHQTKKSILYKQGTKYCPSFQPGEQQSFQIQLKQNINEPPKQLTIGYYNSDITASKWKIEKIVLINNQNQQRTVFICKEPLIRNDFNLRAEQIFQAQTDDEQSTRKQSVSTDEENNQVSNVTHQRSSSIDNNLVNSRPKTRRGREQNSNENNERDNWKSTTNEPVDPLEGLDQIQTTHYRTNSIDSSSNTDNQFKDWYKNNNSQQQQDENDD